MTTSELIGVLVLDEKRRWQAQRSLWLAIAAGTAIAGAVFVVEIGPREDIAFAMTAARFLYKFVVVVPLALVAGVLVSRTGRPEFRMEQEIKLLAVPALPLSAGLAVELCVVPPTDWLVELIGSNAVNCMTLVPLMSIGPLLCLLVGLQSAAPADGGRAGALAGLAAGSISAVFYAVNCFDDSPLFVVTWYPIAIGLVVLGGYLCGRMAIRW